MMTVPASPRERHDPSRRTTDDVAVTVGAALERHAKAAATPRRPRSGTSTRAGPSDPDLSAGTLLQCALQWLGLGVMGVGIGIILGSLLTRWLARKIDELEPGEAGGLYYIPLRSWSLISGAIGVLIFVRSVIRAVTGL